jgi:hypothetical protein
MEQDRALELFNVWFVKPIKSMDIDGGFVAFMVALALYERLIIAKLKLAGQHIDEESVHRKMAEDLNLTDFQRRVFWRMFRNGLLHQGMPEIGKTQYLFHSSFSAFPQFKKHIDSGKTVICIDPSKFADRVLNEFVTSPELILASESFPLASVSEIELDKLMDMKDEI